MKRARITSLTAGALCAAFVACTTVANVGVAAAVPIYPASDPDPFYLQSQGGLAAAAVGGEPLAVRPMPPLLAFPDTDVWQVKYRTTNSEDHPISSVTTVLVPRTRPVNGPLLSYQHIINALGPRCAPSRTLYSNDPDLQIKERRH